MPKHTICSLKTSVEFEASICRYLLGYTWQSYLRYPSTRSCDWLVFLPLVTATAGVGRLDKEAVLVAPGHPLCNRKKHAIPHHKAKQYMRVFCGTAQGRRPRESECAPQ